MCKTNYIWLYSWEGAREHWWSCWVTSQIVEVRWDKKSRGNREEVKKNRQWQKRKIRKPRVMGKRWNKHTHTHVLQSIWWECGPMINHFPGNNREHPLSLFLICCRSVSGWYTAIYSMEEGREKTRQWELGVGGSVMYGPGQLVCTQIKEGNHD